MILIGVPDELSHQFSNLAKAWIQAELPRFSAYARHALLPARGITAKVALDRLEHLKIVTTLHLYSHVVKDSQQDAADLT